MKGLFTFLFFVSFNFVHAQDFTGQWKGEFIDNSTSFVGWGGDRCEYVLELQCKGNTVTGYSYTYFNEGGKRYYTICRLKGFVKAKEKYVEVKEVERTKTNVPTNIRNCFQVHKLSFSKEDEGEKLSGSWTPAPGQDGDCGYGNTVLSRRILKKLVIKQNNTLARTSPKNNSKLPDLHDKNKDQKIAPPVVVKTPATPPVVKNNPAEKSKIVPLIPNNISVKKDIASEDQEAYNDVYEKRNNSVMKTIELANETFKVDLYDNGTVDGDTISLFYNNKLILSHKRLSEKSLTLSLTAQNDRDLNELTMYAENLGEIPPNTALMVITDGPNRYEVRITSDLQKSGTIRFVYKGKSQ